MKPLRLKLSGLNSFREPQEIDFETLCQGGVFGIFGPTGSGKSTILDAITLALFGSVERAAHNTQGILNLAQDSLAVQFTFSLGTGSQRKVYRAERSYKRAGDNSVKAATCRFLEIEDRKETVLAGGTDEVTKKAKLILGLNLDDFTRAVVLPQGKFAEFMTLSPGDRRNMLERLFGLEEYGKNLTARVKQQLDTANYALNGIKERQLGVGDASEDKVQEATATLAKASIEMAAIDQKQSLLKQKFEEIKEIWGLQEDLIRINQRETVLAERQQEITTLEQHLDQAQRAETLRPLLMELGQAEESVRSSHIQVEKANQWLAEALTTLQQSEEQWSIAQRMRTENEPRLLRRLEQLEQGFVLEKEIKEKMDKQSTLNQDLQAKRQVKEGITQELTLLEEKKKNLRLSLESDKSRLQEITVNPEQRTKVEAASRALEAYEKVCRQITAAETDLVDSGQQVTKLEAELTTRRMAMTKALANLRTLKDEFQRLRQSSPAVEDALLADTQEAERCKGVFQNIKREEKELSIAKQEVSKHTQKLEEAQAGVLFLQKQTDKIAQSLAVAKQQYEKVKEKVQNLETQNMAGILVEHLVSGEPCPVCGSSHHPAPAANPDQETLNSARMAVAEAEKVLKDLEDKSKQIIPQLAVGQSKVDHLNENMAKQVLLVQEKDVTVVNLRNDLNSSLKSLEVEEIRAALVRWVSDITDRKTQIALWKERLENLGGEIEKAQTGLNEITTQEANQRAQTEAAKASINQKKITLVQLHTDKQDTQTRLDEARGEIQVEKIPSLGAQFAEWDRESAKINKRLAETDHSLRNTETSLEKADKEKAIYELEIKELETASREAGQNLLELKEKLVAITGGGKTEGILIAARDKLLQIQGNEEKTKVALDHNKEAYSTAEQNMAVKKKEQEMYEQRYDRIQMQLGEGLKVAGFFTVAMAQNSLCDTTERSRMAEEIDSYKKEKTILKEQREESIRKLKSRKLEAAEWLAWPIRIKEVEEAYKLAVSRHEFAKITLEELKKRQAEWTRLESEKQAVSHKVDLLSNLQKVLQGNAFVEYVAQEQLTNVAIDASERLGKLTNQKYALELDSSGGFVIRDDGSGGSRRPVYSFSGGEKFLASLALALALSTQIQLRGEAPLEFFFLDEGFGTLDKDSLEAVMNTLEKLRLQDLAIGIISHVEELQSRLARRLIVTPAQSGGAGSQVKLETA